VTYDDERAAPATDGRSSAARSKLCIGGCLSRLHLGDVSIVPLGDEPAPREIVKNTVPARYVEPRKVGPPVGAAPAAPPSLVPVEAPVLDSDSVVREVHSPIADVAVGGGGRYLILYLPKARELAVFDVSEAKIVRTIPLAEDDIKIAAGLDKLIVL